MLDLQRVCTARRKLPAERSGTDATVFLRLATSLFCATVLFYIVLLLFSNPVTYWLS